MKFAFLLGLHAILASNVIGQDIAIVALLSHGRTLPTGEECERSEVELISNTVKKHVDVRRNLRGDERQLRAPYWCYNQCIGMYGHCYVVYCKCEGHRRLNEEQEVTAPSFHEIPASSSQACTDGISSINAELDSLVPDLGLPCQKVVMASRDFVCYDVVEDEISSLKLWDAAAGKDPVLIGELSEGAEVCAMRINIEAVAGSEVDTVYFELSGSGGENYDRTERSVPYMAFGDNANKMLGRTLDAGTYTIVATPDDSSTKAKTVSFSVSQSYC